MKITITINEHNNYELVCEQASYFGTCITIDPDVKLIISQLVKTLIAYDKHHRPKSTFPPNMGEVTRQVS